jgi:nicotinate-nucleotide pyrophosphorylase (carboxylating)
MPETLGRSVYRDLVARALAEDVGAGDITTRAVVPADATGRGVFLAKQQCVVCGLGVVREVFSQVDERIALTVDAREGEACEPGRTIATVHGPAPSLLTAERTALNFLQQLSGIATVTRRFVDAAGGRITILDTRKTIPGFRALAKYAVRCGGATNHRVGLFDGILIKDNHVRLAGGVEEAVRRARAADLGHPIEVEAQSLDDVDRAIAAGVEIVLLDNMDADTMREAVRRIAGRAKTEISGNVTLERLPALATIGADYVSIGALTHSAPAADISLELDLSLEP